MPANVDSMFSYREMPWHREGVVLDQRPKNWEEARQAAGLDWEPIEETVYALRGVDKEGREIFGPITGWKQLVRSDNSDTLWISRDSYALIDHRAMGEIVEAVLQQHHVKWETGGSLDGGRAVWCLVRLDEPFVLPGDTTVTLPYLAITNRHGQPGACTLRATAVRICCANTFRAAELEGDRTGATFSFRHRAGWRHRLDEAREAVTGARREMWEYRQLAEELLGIHVTDEQREQFITRFIPMPPAGLISGRVESNILQGRDALRDIMASPTTWPVLHTAYGLVQAAGEYLDHVRRSRSWETKLNRTLIRPEPLKAKALNLVRDIVRA